MKILKAFFFTLIGFIFFSGNGNSQTTIASEDFENSFNLFTISSGSGVFFSGTSDVNDRPAGMPFSFLNTSSFGVTNGNVDITSSPIDVSAYTSVQLEFKLAAFSIANTTNGLENDDQVTVSISPDGGVTYYPTTIVRGNANAYWSYVGGIANASTNYDGNFSVVNFQPAGGGERTTDGYSTITITSLPEVSNLRIRISLLNNFTPERWVIDDFKITGTPVTGPLINIYPFALAAFNSIVGNPSLEKTYEVRGRNLTNDIIINAPIGFEVSATSGSGFSPSIILSQTGGNIPLSTVYVRMNSSSVGNKLGILSNISAGAITKNMPVSGIVFAIEPTVSSIVSFSNITGHSMDINFTGGNGAGRLVVMRPGSSVNSLPEDGTDYSASSIFGVGHIFGANQFVVYKGSGSNVNVTGLTSNTTYYAAVFEYNDQGVIVARNYYTTSGTGNATTLVLAEGLELTTTNSIFTIDFDNTVARVNNGTFGGVNVNTAPLAGELNSNAWSINGSNFGGPSFFGGSSNTGGGVSTGNVTTGTYYAFELAPGNRSLGIQPADNYWTPGFITLRLQNNTGTTLDSLAIAYKFHILNNADLANEFYFDYSLDNTTYFNAGQNDTSIAVADVSPVWKTYLRSLILTGLSLPNGSALYIRWKGDVTAATGFSDEFAIDDIKLVANPTSVYPRVAGNFENIIVRGTIQLNGNTNVAANVTVSKGNIELGNNNLIIGGNARGSLSGYLQTNGTGSVTINNISSSRLFPVGTSSYNPVTISNGSNLNWTVNLATGIINPQAPFNSNEAILRTWTITPSVQPPPGGADLTFEYNDGDGTQLAPGFNNSTDVLVWHYDGVSWSTASSAITPTGISGGKRTITLSNWSQYSSFAITNISGALPVKFTSIKVEEETNGIKISWTNLTELNITFYLIERSYDGINFFPIGRVNAVINNGSEAKYNWTDMQSSGGDTFYRIVAFESDGQKKYSQVVKINTKSSSPYFGVYPNPVAPNTQPNFNISNFPKGNYSITISAANGQMVYKGNISHNGGSATIPLESILFLKPGVYFVSMEGVHVRLQTKMMIE